ncbi:hypothetical protein MSG28_012502 [Choristoneura fumiferana]|uniref:Uncharacterized protein n=2 Tax=Choristoneura fumiferana TaxID=7141 RepID=A0ACC0KDC5_CHOFU|nr:hypothetical protein MSG28_012502 [Choristoneura fumiferana]
MRLPLYSASVSSAVVWIRASAVACGFRISVIFASVSSSKEEDKNLSALLSIPYLLNTTSIKQKKKKPNTGCTWKPSKAETRDAFITHVKSDAEIGNAIELRLKTLNDKGVSPQPYMIIVEGILCANICLTPLTIHYKYYHHQM